MIGQNKEVDSVSNGTVISCDYCHKTIEDYVNDLFHFSGTLYDEINNHIHLCRSCSIEKGKFIYL